MSHFIIFECDLNAIDHHFVFKLKDYAVKVEKIKSKRKKLSL